MIKKILSIFMISLFVSYSYAYVPNNNDYSIANAFGQKIESILQSKANSIEFRTHILDLLKSLIQKKDILSREYFLLNRIKSITQNHEGFGPNVFVNKQGYVSSSITKTDIEDLKHFGYFKGDKNARYMILEYSDLNCPYCKKQYQSGIINQILEKYNGEIFYSFRNFPIGLFQGSFELSEKIECTGNLFGSDAYYKQIDNFFSNLKVDDNLIKCSNMQINQKVQRDIDRGVSLFSIQGTPTFIIVDTYKGVYSRISGAYPIDNFIEAIEELKDLYK